MYHFYSLVESTAILKCFSVPAEDMTPRGSRARSQGNARSNVLRAHSLIEISLPTGSMRPRMSGECLGSIP